MSILINFIKILVLIEESEDGLMVWLIFNVVLIVRVILEDVCEDGSEHFGCLFDLEFEDLIVSKDLFVRVSEELKHMMQGRRRKAGGECIG